MADVATLPGIDEQAMELLEAVGYRQMETLARAGADVLTSELGNANAMLKLRDESPSVDLVRAWIDEACRVTGIEPVPDQGPQVDWINHEDTPEVEPFLLAAPFAIPAPSRCFMDHQVAVADVPVAVLLNRHAGPLNARTSAIRPRRRGNDARPVTSGSVRLAEKSQKLPAKREIDTSRMRTTENPDDHSIPIPEPLPSNPDDHLHRLRTPRPDTNKGRNPGSRFYIRGVLHYEPLSVYLGALVTLPLLLALPLALLSTMLLLASEQVPASFGWVPGWLIVFPLALPVAALAWLILAFGKRCRICRQKWFVHTTHLKNPKAHRIPGLGYVVPLCLHLLLFSWFRCSNCGTSIRLKE
ncbi:MAG: DUF4332 domain-containing protein [Verrucomicrobia bacterium]|nr:DUF4332 domain-containing protein [Verrucomicrobiota bacterium]